MKVKFLKSLALLLFLSISLTSCEKSDPIPTELEVQDFVWKGMNFIYLWQNEVPDLADSRFPSNVPYVPYLASYESPADLFQDVLFQPGVVDRFSVIVDDYVALENSLAGINFTTGMEFGLVRYATDESNVFGYVRYVLPGSDAATQGITRGVIFTEVNGTQLTDTNFRDLLFGPETSYTISLADYNGGDPIANGTTVPLIEAQIQENPVHLVTTITEGSNNVGYLMYNQFNANFDGQLNAAFAFLQSQNITDLIIDLRYNGGGRTSTALYMGSMVTGQFTGELFSREIWNPKFQAALSEETFINNFTDQIFNQDSNGNTVLREPINSLNLNRVYFLTTANTASASELVMNSLDPYIEVYSVGTTTIGKVHGSTTLYDSDNFFRTGPNLNTNHTWAIQPLILETVNANNSNNPNGIVPTVELAEDFGDLGVLGERSDPLIDRAMVLITTGNRIAGRKSGFPMVEISNSQINKPTGNNMYQDIKPSTVKKSTLSID